VGPAHHDHCDEGPDSGPPAGAFLHEAMLYSDHKSYLTGTSRFVRDGLAADEPLLVAVPQEKIDAIRGELGPAAERVRFLDMRQAGRNPNRIIPLVLRAFLDEHGGRRARIIGEPIWPGREPDEVPLAIQHEALINKAFAGRPARILCPYDSELLDPAVLSFAIRTHPHMGDGRAYWACAGYTDPDMVIASFNYPLPDASTPAAELVFDAGRLQGLRQMISTHATRAGLAAERIADLQVAVAEVAANTIEPGNGPGVLRIWHEPDRIICEVRGPGEIADWLAGRVLPSEDSRHGRCLLVANALCDLVESHTHPTSITTRLHMRR
jgi:anti-sigma regulatory factor (Ser/Thr protein kinase)